MEVARALSHMLRSEAWTRSSLVEVRYALILVPTSNPEVYKATRAFMMAVQGYEQSTKYDKLIKEYVDSNFKSYKVARRRALSAALQCVYRPLKVLSYL